LYIGSEYYSLTANSSESGALNSVSETIIPMYYVLRQMGKWKQQIRL